MDVTYINYYNALQIKLGWQVYRTQFYMASLLWSAASGKGICES